MAHNKQSKTKDTFIVCTKKPAFIAKSIKFNSKSELTKYTETTKNQHHRVLFKNEILEVISFLGTPPDTPFPLEKTLKRMCTWWLNYGEKEA